MKFGEHLKEERTGFHMSVKELSNLSGVSTAYISKLENGKRKFPSLETIFNLVIGFKKLNEYRYGNSYLTGDINEGYINDLLDRFVSSKDSNIVLNDNQDIYKEFNDYYKDHMDKIAKENTRILSDIYKNKVKLERGTTKKEVVDKPYFDLEWLLTQKEYEVFFGRNFILDDDYVGKKSYSEKDLYFYNILSEKDLSTIRQLIIVFLNNKYFFSKDKGELFNKLTSIKQDDPASDIIFEMIMKIIEENEG
ncbi:helix-turn-helix transcriptional regulator [Staphylococcus simulans]|uniref:helix-turn-helix transcriptional regulator n=1 Tax=Staphylococcus simulans TaxID=1286 RepID=UPI00070B107A|nr:helix-turn-helix transcriptional regulator [Staphylococcus simulans]